MATEYPSNPNPRGGKSPDNFFGFGWGAPAVFAVLVLIAAVIIFSSAGPDRTRTADNNNQPSAVTTPGPTTGEKVPARTPVPSKSNTPGTQ